MSADELDQAMDDRRDELRLRWSQVAQRVPMDPSNLRRIRNGDVPLTKFAARGIDDALEWPAGTAMSYYVTGEPLEAAPREADPDVKEEMRERVRERLLELRREGLSHEDVMRIVDDVKAELLAARDRPDAGGDIAGSTG